MIRNLNAKTVYKQNVVLSLDDVGLDGELSIPEKAKSVVLFIDGSGSDNSDSITRFVARELNSFGHATLVLDLMTAEEQSDEESHNRRAFGFHSEFLAHRVLEAHRWLRLNGDTEKLPIGFFGVDEGAEAALIAASRLQRKVKSMVIAGGWINLPKSLLKQITSPTLFITRTDRLEDSLQARAVADNLACEFHLEPISEDEGDDYCLERIAEITRNWISWYQAEKKQVLN